MAPTHDRAQFTGGKALSHQSHIVAILARVQRQWKHDEVVNGSGGEPGLEPGISIPHGKYSRPRDELDCRELNRQVVGQVVSSVPIPQKMRIETDN